MDNLAKFCKITENEDPRFVDFDSISIDPKIKEFVTKINKSNWVYTVNSCQGHIDSNNVFNMYTYFVFIVDINKIDDFLNQINKVSDIEIVENINLINTFKTDARIDYSDDNYMLISFYFAMSFVDNDEFYENLTKMANEIIENG